MGYEVELLTSVDQLAALAPEWTALARRAEATVFQTPAWVLPWWTQFGEGDVATPVVRRAGELVGLAPAYVRLDGEGAFIGSGNTDYVDALCDPRCTADVAREILGVLGTVPCDRWVLQPLDASSALTAAAASGCITASSHFDVYPRLSLPPSVEQLDGMIPRHHLAKLRRARNALERRGELTFASADTESAETLLGAVERLHAARWASRGAPGVLVDERVRGFHRAVVRRASEFGALRLYDMRLDGTSVAAFYGFSWNRRTFYYIGGYDPAYAKYSVGSLVILHAIENAVRGGDTTFDFLRGGEAYKYAWGAQPAVGVSLLVTRTETWSPARARRAAVEHATKTAPFDRRSERVLPFGSVTPDVHQEGRMSSHSSHTTTNHDEIRRWAEARGAKPSRVKGTGSGDDPGMIRLDFPGFSGAGSLESISWDEWFKAFDDNDLALVYQDRTADGAKSNFNKLIARDTADERARGDSHASRHSGASTTHRSDRSSSSSSHSRSSHQEPQHASDRDRESLRDREYRDSDGTVHHHTHKYMDEHRDD